MLVLRIERTQNFENIDKNSKKHIESVGLSTKSVAKAKKIADEMIDEDSESIKSITIQNIDDNFKVTNICKKYHYVMKYLFSKWETQNIY